MEAETRQTSPVGAQERVYRVRPYGLALRLFYTVLFTGAAVGVAITAFFVAREVALDCSRAAGTCVITRTYPLFGARRERFPLAAIQGTRLRQRATKNGALAYAVLLRTAQGDLEMSANYATTGRLAQKRDLDAFLGDPETPALHLTYDQGSPFGLVLGLFSLVMLVPVWSLWQEARVHCQDWRQTVVLERRRWPLPVWSRSLPRDQVAGNRIATRGVSSRRTFQLRLVLTTGEEVPLLQGWAGAPFAWYQQAAGELDRFLSVRA